MGAGATAWAEGFFDAEYVRLFAPTFDAGEHDAGVLWRALALAPGARVIDAPCGYGRVARPLAARGAVVVGVDRAAAQLAEAERRRGAIPAERLTYARHDLRRPLPAALRGRFDAGLNLASSLGYGEEEDDVAMLGSLAGAVRPGGQVALETRHRDMVAALLGAGAGRARTLPDGSVLAERSELDALTGRLTTVYRWEGPTGAGERRASFRLYTATELVRLLARAGLPVERALALGDGAPFAAAGPDLGGPLLLVARRT